MINCSISGENVIIPVYEIKCQGQWSSYPTFSIVRIIRYFLIAVNLQYLLMLVISKTSSSAVDKYNLDFKNFLCEITKNTRNLRDSCCSPSQVSDTWPLEYKAKMLINALWWSVPIESWKLLFGIPQYGKLQAFKKHLPILASFAGTYLTSDYQQISYLPD